MMMMMMMMIVENCASVWLVSGYAYVFIQLFVVIVPPLC